MLRVELSPAARELAVRQKLAVSQEDLERLDGDDDRTVSADELAGALRVADLDKDKVLSDRERATFKKLLGDRYGLGRGMDADYLREQVAHKVGWTRAEVDHETAVAKSRFDRVAGAIPKEWVPAEGTTAARLGEDLGSVRARIRELESEAKPLEARIQGGEGRLGQIDAHIREQQKIAAEPLPPEGPRTDLLRTAKAYIEQERAAAPASQRRSIEERLADVSARLEDAEKKQAVRSAAETRRSQAQSQIRDAQRERDEVVRDLSSARSDLRANQISLDGDKKREHQLSWQHEHASAKEDLAKKRAQQATVHKLAGPAIEGEDRQVSGKLTDAERALRKAEGVLDDLNSDSSKFLAREVMKLKHVEQAVESGQLKRRDVKMDKLRDDIDRFSAPLERKTRDLEYEGRSLIRSLRDPEYRAALERKPEAYQASMLRRSIAVLSKTEDGRKFIESDIVPAMRGDANSDPYWREMLKPKSPDDARPRAILDGARDVVALQPDGGKLLDQGWEKALGVNAGQMVKVEEAIAQHRSGDPQRAKRTLEEAGLGHLAVDIDRLGQSFVAKELALTLVEIGADNRLRNTFKYPRDVLSTIELVGGFCKESSRFGKLSKICGRAAAPLNLVTGCLGLSTATERGDVGGTVGNAMVTTGGVAGTVGLGLVVTGIGAPVGAACLLYGGLCAGIGYAVDLFFGDSDTEKALKAMGLSQYID